MVTSSKSLKKGLFALGALCLAGAAPASAQAVYGLKLYDESLADQYSIQSNFNSNSMPWYDQSTYQLQEVPRTVVGSDFIQVSSAERLYAGDSIMQFTMAQSGTVYLAFKTTVTPPAWVTSNYTNSSADSLIYLDGAGTRVKRTLWSKTFAAGQTVTLLSQYTTADNQYPVIVRADLGTGLSTWDATNASYYSVAKNFQLGSLVYNDRSYTVASADADLIGSTYIPVPCNSRLYTGDSLMSFTMGMSGLVRVAVSSNLPRPAWIDSTWNGGIPTTGNGGAGDTLSTTQYFTMSNGIDFMTYEKFFDAGDRVVLFNQYNPTYAQYIVFLTTAPLDPWKEQVDY